MFLITFTYDVTFIMELVTFTADMTFVIVLLIFSMGLMIFNKDY